MPLKIFKLPPLLHALHFCKIKRLSSPSLWHNCTHQHLAPPCTLSLNSKAWQPLLRITAGFRDTSLNITSSYENGICLVGTCPKPSFLLIVSKFQPPTPKVFSRFQQLTLQEGFLSLFLFFIFIYKFFCLHRCVLFLKKLNYTCLIKCFSEDCCTNNTVKGLFYLILLFFWIRLKVVSMLQFHRSRNKAFSLFISWVSWVVTQSELQICFMVNSQMEEYKNTHLVSLMAF